MKADRPTTDEFQIPFVDFERFFQNIQVIPTSKMTVFFHRIERLYERKPTAVYNSCCTSSLRLVF